MNTTVEICYLSVCDGSEMLKYSVCSIAGIANWEARLYADYTEHWLWCMKGIESTIGRLGRLVKRTGITAYMYDNGIWYRCRKIDNKDIIWEEINDATFRAKLADYR